MKKTFLILCLSAIGVSQPVLSATPLTNPKYLNIPDKWYEVKGSKTCSEDKWDEYADRYQTCTTQYWRFKYDKNNNLIKKYKVVTEDIKLNY